MRFMSKLLHVLNVCPGLVAHICRWNPRNNQK